MPKSLFGYNVVSRIGGGAGSALYAVTDPAGQLFAMKHVVIKEEKDERFFQQLQNEFDVSRLFRHPSLRKVIDLKIPRKFFSKKIDEAGLVLEWVDGQGLDENTPTDVQKLLSIFTHCAGALASMHKLKLVHCDFKPHNVLISTTGQVKVIDFGQTCKMGTEKQRVQGTPDFITPEQVKRIPVDQKTDIYSLGASLYWALTGQKVPTYFTVGKHERDIVKLQQFPTPRALRPELPEALSELIMQCLRYNPGGRPSDMVTVLNALQSFVTPGTGGSPAAAE